MAAAEHPTSEPISSQPAPTLSFLVSLCSSPFLPPFLASGIANLPEGALT